MNPSTKNKGMKGDRSRNASGKLRRKRGDTHVGNIEKRYGVDFDVRSDMHLDTLRKKEEQKAISDLIQS